MSSFFFVKVHARSGSLNQVQFPDLFRQSNQVFPLKIARDKILPTLTDTSNIYYVVDFGCLQPADGFTMPPI